MSFNWDKWAFKLPEDCCAVEKNWFFFLLFIFDFRSLAPWLTGMIVAVVIFVVLIPAICSACFHYYYYKHGFEDELEWSDNDDEDDEFSGSECDDEDDEDDNGDDFEEDSVSSNHANGVTVKKHRRRFKFCACLDGNHCKLSTNKSSVQGKRGRFNFWAHFVIKIDTFFKWSEAMRFDITDEKWNVMQKYEKKITLYRTIIFLDSQPKFSTLSD